MKKSILAAVALVATSKAPLVARAQAGDTSASAATAVPLPGSSPVGMDYLAYDPAKHRVWVPAGNTGNVDVVDALTLEVTAIGGFKTRPATRPGRPPMGPSSATVGDGVVWVGNRGDNRLCAFDRSSLEKRSCLQLAAMPDGLAYVVTTKELWATTPESHTFTIVSEHGGRPSALKLPGSPEGYAVDQTRGLVYTNLEDQDRTLAIDVATRKVVASWSPGCGEAGPRGLALDPERRFLFVACTDGAVALDVAHDGKVLGRLKVGAGVDNLDYRPQARRLYVASGKDATLTVVGVGGDGALTAVATLKTAPGARNPVVDEAGKLFVPDGAQGRLLVFPAAAVP